MLIEVGNRRIGVRKVLIEHVYRWIGREIMLIELENVLIEKKEVDRNVKEVDRMLKQVDRKWK